MKERHYLKTIQPYFDSIMAGEKNFEVRLNDRGYERGDTLVLREWDGEIYTGRIVYRRITYVLLGGAFGIEFGYAVLGLGLI